MLVLALLALLTLPVPQAAGPGAEAAALKKSCDKGAAADCLRLAGIHGRGEGVPRDAEKAAGFLKKGCDLNLAAACLELAAAARTGTGTKKEPERAALLYQKACDGGAAAGCAA